MLRAHRNDVVPLLPIHVRRTLERQIIAFRRPAGKDDLPRAGADAISDLPAGLVDCFLRVAAEAVLAAGGVAVLLAEERNHHLHHPGIGPRRGMVVHVYRKLKHDVMITHNSFQFSVFSFQRLAATRSLRSGARQFSAVSRDAKSS